MSQKIYLKILRWGIYLSFFSVLLTWKRFYFPYISTKQIYFDILLEILFIFWVAFIVKYPSWRPFGNAQGRPKKSWITIGLIGFFLALLVSCFKSVDFNLSFWGDIERMLGFFPLFHFLILYFIIITVMRSWEDWKNLFLVFVGVGLAVSIHGIAQRLGIITSPWGSGRIIATIGNAAYVGAFAIFNLFFLSILFVKTKDRIWRICLSVASFVILLALIFSGTRGSYLGFGVSIVLMLLLLAFFSKSKKIKIYSLTFILFLVIFVGTLFLNADKSFVKNNLFLGRITQINLNDATMQTRFISWRAAAKDFKNHPVFGTGLGNYAIIFDKYFDPTFYNYTRSETYFDQAHNNLIDIVSTSGLLGIITYLSIFLGAIFYLIRGLRRGNIGTADFILLFGLMTAYFIQNLVVFDALATYIPLMIMLGYIHWLSRGGETQEFSEERNRDLENKEIFVFLIIGISVLFVTYQFSIKPAKMLIGTIDGQISFARGDGVGGVEAYKKALSYNTVLDRDSRASFLRYTNSMSLNGDKEKTKAILDYAVSLAELNVKYNPSDNLMQLQLAQVLDSAARVYAETGEKFYYYSNYSLEVIDRAINSSPGRIPIYFTKAQIYLTRGEADNAIETLKYAVNLNKDYYESSCQLAKVYIIIGKTEDGYPIMNECLDKGGIELLSSSSSFLKILINHYLDVKDIKNLILLHEALVKIEPNDAALWVNLSKLYLETGEKEKAIESARKAAQLDKSLEASVEKFVESLK